MIKMAHLEYRVVVLQGIVAIMVAERTFGSADVRRDLALDGKFDIGHQLMPAQRILGHLQFVADEQGSEEQFRQILRERGDGGEHKSRRATDKKCHRQGLVSFFGFIVMVPAAFMDLPMDAGGGIVVPLDAVHAEVMPFAVRDVRYTRGAGSQRARRHCARR